MRPISFNSDTEDARIGEVGVDGADGFDVGVLLEDVVDRSVAAASALGELLS
jgi:hypothetical protein